MQTIVVTGPGDPELERLRDAMLAAGVTVVPTVGDDVARVLAEVVASGERCTVLGVREHAGRALDAASEHGTVAGFVSLAGDLDERHLELVEEWPELPVLAVAPADDRAAVASAVDAYLASDHIHSDLVVSAAPADDEIVSWLVARMAEHVEVASVTCSSSDGWEIHGTLRMPQRKAPIPGVVLLHTGRSDRAAYARLERLLSDAGLAVLNIDWRGRGESINLGTYFDLDPETKAAAWRDAMAAFDTLAADPRVDADRLAGVGCVHGAEYAVRAAWRNRRVRALVILTGYRPTEPEEEELLVSGEVDVLYVNAVGHTITGQAMHELRDSAPRRSAHLIEYPGSALGYQLFEIDPGLEPRIVEWLAEVLT